MAPEEGTGIYPEEKLAIDCFSSASTSRISTRSQFLSDREDDASREDDTMLLSSRSLSFEVPVVCEDFDFDLPLRWYKRLWSFILCIAGMFDILAYMEPTFRNSYDGICAVGVTDFGENLSHLLLDIEAEGPSTPWYCSVWITFLNRLRDYNIVIAFCFSFLWFNYSQSKAREEYHYKFTVQEDRMQLQQSDDVTTTHSSSSNSGFEMGEAKWENDRKDLTKRKMKKFNARNAYYRRITSRMLLLPVGFYIILYQFVRGLMNGQWLYHEILIKPANETIFVVVQDPNEYVTIEISKIHAKMSTIFAIFTYLKYHLLLRTRLLRSEFLQSAIPILRRKLVVNATRNPRNFWRQLQTVLKYIRWIKYSVPLVVKLNKLRGNTASTLRKRRLYIKARRRRSFVQKLLGKKQTQAEDDAAVLIQRAWRTHRNHLYQRVVDHFVKDKRLSAAMKIQLSFRRMSLRSRIHRLRKKRELHHLELLKRRPSEKMDDDERRRLYELQDEFMVEAKKTINKRLLIKPNTKFSVVWNAIFIFCVLIEVSHNALKPWLKIPKAKRTDDRKHKSMRLFLAESLIPTQVAETPACRGVFQKSSALQRLFYGRHHVEQPTRKEVVSAFIDEITDDIADPDYGLENIRNNSDHTTSTRKIPWKCSPPISTWRDSFRSLVRLAISPQPISEWPSCKEKDMTLVDMIVTIILPFRKKTDEPFQWYCSRPYSTIHDCYRLSWNFIIDQIHVVVSITCFFDVYVKFFTGEIDLVTGQLRPKLFFRRWIFPGLLLQLLVNPAIGSFSDFFFRVTNIVMLVGPVRVLRWCIAVVVPIVYALRNIVVDALQEAESDKQLAQYGMMLLEYSH
mmetsp:Transcript_106868/g.217996  ORF Transcript_106868/g.217996 Transcript_106868/m.217996 type:complete len:848 (-) Transcript_106868:426-2969(-)